ncbi:MAG: PTS sugar transporter subunit IIC, partial [Endomicrobia bacterium]|nr:PTS sugar transporter subunit IIC [Endomicrobiia bacterium]
MIGLEFLLVILIVSLAHLDVLTIGQFMIHRPIVVGPLTGILLGIPEYGVLTGVIFELIYISVIPVGIKVPPDATASVVFTMISYSYNKECYILSLIFGIIVGIIYKSMDLFSRSVNSMVLNWVDTAKNDVLVKRINLLVVYGIITTYLKTILFYLILFPVMQYIINVICRLLYNFSVLRNIDVDLIYILPAIGIG